MQLIFSKLFKPKWQHRRADVRKQAIRDLEPENLEHQSILETVACQDNDPSVRCLAVTRLNQLERLQQMLREEALPDVRDAILQRYQLLLAGGGDCPLPLEQRLPCVQSLDAEEILLHLALEADSNTLREAAVERISSPAELEQIALNGPTSQVRQRAADKLSDPAAMERVQGALKQKDKGAYRIIRTKLQALRDAEAAQQALEQQARECCESLEHLARTELFPHYQAKFDALLQNWERLPAEIRAPLCPRFEAARQGCRTTLEEAARARAEAEARQALERETDEQRQQLLQELSTQAEGLAHSLSDGQPQAGIALSEARATWSRLDLVIAASPATQRTFTSRCQRVDELKTLAERYAGLKDELEALLANAEAPPATTDADEPGSDTPPQAAQAPSAAARIRDLDRLRQRLNWPGDLPHPPLLQQLDELRSALSRQSNTRNAPSASPTAPPQQALKKQLEDLDTLLKEGEARSALHLHRQLQPLFAENRVPASLQTRFKALHARALELKSWQQYAIVPKKEELCERMEALIGSPLPPASLADSIKALQQAWKELENQDSEHQQHLWHRFKQASDQAYEPCKAYFAELSEQRLENLKKRETLCEQLQIFIDGTDWSQPDWALVEQVQRTAKQEWRGYSPVNRKPGQALQERFNAQLAQIDGHLKQEFQRNAERKRTLAEAAEQLLTQDDLHQATETAKQLQQQWKVVGKTFRKPERELWGRFRSACNTLFDRRKQQWQARQEAQSAQLAIAHQLCAALEQQTPSALDSPRRYLAEQKNAFAALDLSGRQAAALEERFASACERFLEQLSEPLLSDAQQRQLATCRAHCHQLEARLLEPSEAQDDPIDPTPCSACQLPDTLRQQLDDRLAMLAQCATAPERLEPELEKAERLQRLICIRLEILANLPSPDEDQPLRMEYQMTRLKDALEHAQNPNAPQRSEVEELVWLWQCTAFEGLFPELQARFERLTKALH